MNPFFVDYLMPTINMMPRIETTLVHCYPGAGEIPCVRSMVAIANSIFNSTGLRITKLPLIPEGVENQKRMEDWLVAPDECRKSRCAPIRQLGGK